MNLRKGAVPLVRTVTYRGGTADCEELLLDVHRAPRDSRNGPEAPGPAVLLWHGAGPKERGVLAPLAGAVAARGLTAFVPDWRPDAADGGASDLLASWNWVVANAGEFGADPGRVTVAGWSAGAGAALGVALLQDSVTHPGHRRSGESPEYGAPGGTAPAAGRWPSAVVGLAGHYRRPARTTGRAPWDDCDGGLLPRARVYFAHGTRDAHVHIEESRSMARALRSRGVGGSLLELPVDHAGIVGTAYDAEAGRCVPAQDPAILAALASTAEMLARAAGSVPVTA